MKRPLKITNPMKRVEAFYNLPIEEVMRQLYVDENLSMREIADRLFVGLGTVHLWLQQCGITSRKVVWNKGLTKDEMEKYILRKGG